MISGFHYVIYVLFSHYENTNPILMINDLQYNDLLKSVGTVLFIPYFAINQPGVLSHIIKAPCDFLWRFAFGTHRRLVFPGQVVKQTHLF